MACRIKERYVRKVSRDIDETWYIMKMRSWGTFHMGLYGWHLQLWHDNSSCIVRAYTALRSTRLETIESLPCCETLKCFFQFISYIWISFNPSHPLNTKMLWKTYSSARDAILDLVICPGIFAMELLLVFRKIVSSSGLSECKIGRIGDGRSCDDPREALSELANRHIVPPHRIRGQAPPLEKLHSRYVMTLYPVSQTRRVVAVGVPRQQWGRFVLSPPCVVLESSW